jgi:3-hydroxymyristoyl/3-hydroxydecanoyl-(acyl carrier protein) dehydratase
VGTLTTLMISAEHPAFAGHFPGAPVLPAVVLLDATLEAIELASGQPCKRWQIASAKFPSAVRPGETLTLEHEQLPNGSIRFAVRTTGRAVANGHLTPSGVPDEQDRGK